MTAKCTEQSCKVFKSQRFNEFWGWAFVLLTDLKYFFYYKIKFTLKVFLAEKGFVKRGEGVKIKKKGAEL